MSSLVSKQIAELKTFIAEGDIAGMARNIEALHESEDSLDEADQKEIGTLEAIFLSIVNIYSPIFPGLQAYILLYQ